MGGFIVLFLIWLLYKIGISFDEYRKSPVRINYYLKDHEVKIYNDKEKLVGRTSSLIVFTDVRLQIAEKNLTGWYLIYQGKRHYFTPSGSIEDWPAGLFDIYKSQLKKLGE